MDGKKQDRTPRAQPPGAGQGKPAAPTHLHHRQHARYVRYDIHARCRVQPPHIFKVRSRMFRRRQMHVGRDIGLRQRYPGARIHGIAAPQLRPSGPAAPRGTRVCIQRQGQALQRAVPWAAGHKVAVEKDGAARLAARHEAQLRAREKERFAVETMNKHNCLCIF